MAQIVHEFTVRRQGREIELRASFEITPTKRLVKKHAIRLDGEIFLADGIPWEGHLTRSERGKIEDEVWESYRDEEQSVMTDDCIVDEAFDDGFDIDMAIRTSGHGYSVTW